MNRVAVFTGPGQPMVLTRIPQRAPQGRELLVRVTMCTLCRSDLHTYLGRRAEVVPAVLGHEIVGEIAAFGPDALHFDGNCEPVVVGSRISWAVAVGCGSCFYCQEHLPQKCERPFKYGHQPFMQDLPPAGGLAEFITLVPRTVWYRVPDEVPNIVAAPVNCATATVVASVRHGGDPRDRDVAILGAGVLGLTACAMAHADGARSVIVADKLPANRERAKRFGATHAFAAGTDELASGVRDITQGRGADIVFELAGTADSATTALDLGRVGATIILAGTVAPVGSIALDPEKVVRRMLTIRGVHNYHPSDLANALQFLAGPGRTYPWQDLVVACFSLEQVDEAFAAAQQHPGLRIAVIPSSSQESTNREHYR